MDPDGLKLALSEEATETGSIDQDREEPADRAIRLIRSVAARRQMTRRGLIIAPQDKDNASASQSARAIGENGSRHRRYHASAQTNTLTSAGRPKLRLRRSEQIFE